MTLPKVPTKIRGKTHLSRDSQRTMCGRLKIKCKMLPPNRLVDEVECMHCWKADDAEQIRQHRKEQREEREQAAQAKKRQMIEETGEAIIQAAATAFGLPVSVMAGPNHRITRRRII